MVGEVGLEPTKRKASRLQRDGIAANRLAHMYLAPRVRFELTEYRYPTVFKTAPPPH